MADIDTNALLNATAEVLEATGKVIRSLNTDPGAPAERSPSPSRVAPAPLTDTADEPQDLSKSDSPAWYDAHHPDGSVGVKALGKQYHDVHMAAKDDPNNPPNHAWDPSKGATWKDFARISQGLFANDQLYENGAMRPTAFPHLRRLQAMMEYYDVNAPDKVIPAAFPWPTATSFPAKNKDWTVQEALSAYLGHFNRKADGTLADRAADFPGASAGVFRLSHGQCVELRHMLQTQEDLRLLAPYDVLDQLVW